MVSFGFLSFGVDSGNRSFASGICFANLRNFLSLLLSQKMDDAVSITAKKIHKKIGTVKPQSRFLVEMAVIETASENTFPRLSTSVAVLLEFPYQNAEGQALRLGSPVVCDGIQSSYPCTFTA